MKDKTEKKTRSSIVRDSLDTFGTNAIGAAITLISTFLVLNRVDPSIKGLYNTVQLWGGGFASLLGLSINSAVMYFVARYKVQNTRGAIRKLTFWIGGAIVIIGSLLMVLLRNSQFFYQTPVPYLIAIVIYGVSSFILNICLAVLRGENKFRSFNIINLIQRILVFLLAVVVFLRPSAAVWVWFTNAISIAMIAVAFYSMKRWSGPMPEPAAEDNFTVQTGSMVKYSLKSHVSNVMTYINSYLGSYIVQGAYGTSNFGVYNTAYTMMQQVWILPDAVSLVIMTRIASMKEQSEKQKLTVVSCKIVTYISAVIAVALVWVANLLVPVVFPKYIGALNPLKYLIVGSIFISYAKVLNNSIAAYGRPELNIIPTAIGIVANLALSVALAPVFGMNGVAIATSLSLTLQGISSIIIFCTFTKTPFYRLFLPTGEEIAMAKGIIKK
ncbi:MAG TPA: polysaccharide biosynthesis C-terminal domain-containing protein [Caproiciproducens sp.]|nr:polysaccharide biosynthesis C-terminal domain-containing protein [Caproiciproducens sp.]